MTTEQELARHSTNQPTLLTVGVFDGVHLGHISLLNSLIDEARERSLLPGVITFTPHPQTVFHPERPVPLLSSVDERIELIREAGIDLVVLLTFTRDMSRYTSVDFVLLLSHYLHLQGLVLGPDASLGRDREGTARRLKMAGKTMGFTVADIPFSTVAGEVVSSTAIRNALAEGDLEKAARMLGRRYSLSGTIVTTSHRGASMGFPTANLDVGPERALPANGVYATIANVRGKRYKAVTNIGLRPTFGDTERIVETHILDFTGDIYGSALQIEFAARIRDERPFENQEALVAQIRKDVDTAQRILGALP
ncbi:MAG: bifunctional riboflavin kinase/FAD synthetase [Chloroflexota bacterium]